MRAEAIALGDRIAEQAAHLDAAMYRLLTDLRDFDQQGYWHQAGARSCAHWLSWRVSWDLGTAREHLRVARRLGELPAVGAALSRGELSYSKVRGPRSTAPPGTFPRNAASTGPTAWWRSRSGRSAATGPTGPRSRS